MLQVRKDLCVGCGLCTQHCPQGAISLFQGKAEIDRRRCNSCGQCLTICPQGAITERIPVPAQRLKTTVVELQAQADDIIHRLEGLKSRK